MIILLDMACALAALAVAGSCFVVHVLSSPKGKLGMPMPLYVRIGIWLVGADGLFRSVHWGWLSFRPGIGPGHTTWLTLASWTIYAYYFASIVMSISRRRLPPETWEVLRKIAIEELKSRGFKVVK